MKTHIQPFLVTLLIAVLAGCSGPSSQSGADPDSAPDMNAPSDAGDDVDEQGRPDVNEPADAEEDADIPEPPDADGPMPEACPFTWCDDDAPLPETTEQDLQTFWDANGGRQAFPRVYVDVVEALLKAEDEVVAGEHQAARTRIDEIFERYPLSDNVWWSGVGQSGTNVGTPVAYYGLRMLDEIANTGLSNPPEETLNIRLSIALVTCAQGVRPTNLDLTEDEEVNLTLDEGVRQDDFFAIRQSLRLFRHYVWAITGGRLWVKLAIEAVESCLDLTHSPSPPIAGLANYGAAIAAVRPELDALTDMWWVLYPSNVPSDPIFDDTAFITGGMGGWGQGKPVFIIDDLWLVRKPPHLGRGLYTAVERRVYLPQWLQHEFFHHLYRTWPEFGLEAMGHQWFDRGTWPDDFVGQWEPDYYAESLHKRLAQADPPIHEALQKAVVAIDLSDLSAADLVGDYVRMPNQNLWHEVSVGLDGESLSWHNAADVSWSLRWEDAELWAGPDCPYGEQMLSLELDRDENGRPIPVVVGLWFGGELYQRQ